MVRTVYYASTSLDGFDTAGLDPTEVRAAAGAVVMGAGTYARLLRQVRDYGPAAWDCPRGPVWVYTHHEFPGVEGADVMFVRGPVTEFAPDIEDSANGSDVWLRGPGLAAQYLQEGLLDELHLTLHPMLLGQGNALFGGTAFRQAQLVRAEPAGDGSLRLHYSFETGT